MLNDLLTGGALVGEEQVLLHVGGEDVEDQGADAGDAEDDEEGARMAQDLTEAAGVLVRPRFCGGGLFEAAAQPQGDDGGSGTDDERQSPPAGFDLFGAQGVGHDDGQEAGQQLSADECDVLEGGVEAALTFCGDLGHVGRGGAVFAADGQSLDHAHHEQEDRRQRPGGGRGRQNGHEQGSGAHEQDRDEHRVLTAEAVGCASEDVAADGAHEEADEEDACGLHE